MGRKRGTGCGSFFRSFAAWDTVTWRLHSESHRDKKLKAYLEHAVLGPRLRECTHLVNLVEERSIDQIFGHPDDLKFRSSMTLFASVANDNQVFKDALQNYFAGEPDYVTLERL